MSWNNIWEIGLRAESLLGNTVTVIRTLLPLLGPLESFPAGVTAAQLPG